MDFYCPLPSISSTSSRPPPPDMVSVDCAWTNFSDHSTPVLCPSKNRASNLKPHLLKASLSSQARTQARVLRQGVNHPFMAHLLSLYLSYFLSSFHLVTSHYLPACLSSDFSWLLVLPHWCLLAPSFQCLTHFHGALVIQVWVLKSLTWLVHRNGLPASPILMSCYLSTEVEKSSDQESIWDSLLPQGEVRH